jgi:protein TonB
MRSTAQGKTEQEYAGKETILGRCLVEGDPETTLLARRARRKTFGVSLAIEILLLAVLVAAPLFTSTAQTQLGKILPPQLTFFGNWREHSQVQHVDGSKIVLRTELPNPYVPDPPMGATVSVRHDEEADVFPGPDISGGDGLGNGQQTGIPDLPLLIEPPRIAAPAREEKRPLKLSEGVLQAQIISRIEPQYPLLAKQTKTEGTVQLHAIIGRDGRITSLEVISGHPLLVEAALKAVRQWTYRPTLLNGEPVEVETSITVIFRLRQ